MKKSVFGRVLIFFVLSLFISTALKLHAVELVYDYIESAEPIAVQAYNPGSGISADELYAFIDSGQLNIVVTGKKLNHIDRYNFFIDTDASDKTGYQRWRRSGADYMVENTNLYAAASNDVFWNWKRIPESTPRLTIHPEGNSAVLRIKLKDIDTSLDVKSLGVGFMYYSAQYEGKEGFIPACDKGMPLIGRNRSKKAESPYLINTIPYAIGLGIDDLGWDFGYYYKDEEGNRISEEERDWQLADYQNLIDIGRAVGSRLMTAWILADLDKEGAAAKPEYNPPHTSCFMTRRGTRPNTIDNPEKIEQLMELVKNGADAMEFGIHGVSHEHYYPKHDGSIGLINREFAYRPPDSSGFSYRYEWEDLIKRMQCYGEIVRQYYDEETCSFPESVVFPGHGYYYGDVTGNETTGRLMNMFGVKYANGATASCTSMGAGAIDNGLLYINRAFGAAYDKISATPWDGTNYPDGLYLPNFYGWTEAHFPNLWNTTVDDTDAYDKWIDYLSGLNNCPSRYLAPNTVQGSSQWLYRHYAELEPIDRNSARIDTSHIPDEAYQHDLLSTLVVKIPLETGMHISSSEINNGACIVGYHEDAFGYGCLRIGHESNTMGRLSPETIYTLSVTVGTEQMDSYVDLHKKTYNIFSFSETADEMNLDIEMYGTQEVVIKTDRIPETVNSTNPQLEILKAEYSAPFLKLQVRGKDIQGEKGSLIITFR